MDCNAFFASVEQAVNPALRGRPVITGKERGIASAMSYEAKRLGVTRGMRLFEIKKICPDDEDTCHIQALRALSRVIDEVNSAYGKHTLHLGSTDRLNQFSQHLGDRGDLAPRKKILLKGETFRQRLKLPLWNVKV